MDESTAPAAPGECPTVNGKRWLSMLQITRHYTISMEQIRAGVHAGELPAYRRGQAIRIFVEDLEEWLRRKPIVPKQPSQLSR